MPDGVVFSASDCGTSLLTVELDPSAPPPARVTLVKLGAVTHHNDVSQRFIELCAEGDLEPCIYQQDDDTLEVFGPCAASNLHQHGAIAPPGYYMLFVLSEDGVPSVAEYVQVQQQGAGGLELWQCKPDELTAAETSCNSDPTGGCPSGSVVSNLVALPSTGGGEGWTILTDAGAVEDVSNPTSTEVAMIEDLCIEACELQWEGRPDVTAACSSSGAFDSASYYGSLGTRAQNFIPSTKANGQGLFSMALGCTLTHNCCWEFDENICLAINDRPTPQSQGIDVSPEYRKSLRSSGQGDKAQFEVTTNTGTYASYASGEIAYSFCTEGEQTACPFYLSDLSMSAVSSMNVTFSAGGSPITKTISNLEARLVQPAFGQAEEGFGAWTDVGFPSGGLFVEVEFDVDGNHFKLRRATTSDTFGEAQASGARVVDLEVPITVPVNGTEVSVTVAITIHTDGDLEGPPTVSIDVPSTVTCGVSFTLDATVSDPDDDLDEVRWRVGGQLLSPTTTSLNFSSGSRVLSATAIDERGAATTIEKTITCST